MKHHLLSTLIALSTLGLAACGGAPAPSSEQEAASSNTLQYVLNGQSIPASTVAQLEAVHGQLYYLVTADSSGPIAAVYTHQDAFDRVTGAVQNQALCVSVRTKTTVYDWEHYGSDRLELNKGTQIADLAALLQADGESWDNDISSFKGADCVYTYLYTGRNFSGSVWASKGSAFSTMGGWNNTVSSIVVGN